ncbi:MAG: alpha/beta fold hydrolase, partial [Rhodoluna sp.]|nr:alpha/beta fold hydrolase [Rhodoluna sp.]
MAKRSWSVIAAISSLALALSACTGSSLPSIPLGPVEGGPQPSADSAIPADLQPFYTQAVQWSTCAEPDILCADIEVPADWSNPSGERLKVAIAYRKADNETALGSVIFNPGGPGSSGVDWIKNSATQIGTTNLRANFNLVGFDPRGVGDSEPKITCLDAKNTDEFLYSDSEFGIGTDRDIAATRASIKEFTDACLANTGPNLQFVDTASAAKDLDVIRAVFGDEKINYLGFSYGTFLGTMYAELFPIRVGSMVLDGAIDPTVTEDAQNISQLIGFDRALKTYLTSCLESQDCPFSGSLPNAEKQIQQLLLQIEKKPLPTDSERDLTIWSAITGIIMPLYGQTWWPTLTEAFAEAKRGDGTILLALADTYNNRLEDGSYGSNMLEANISISCMDGRQAADAKSIAAQNKLVLQTSSTFGRYWQFGALTCEHWPFPVAARPSEFAAKGSAPILVIGTTGDPATPYEQAVALANEVLENAQLVT